MNNPGQNQNFQSNSLENNSNQQNINQQSSTPNPVISPPPIVNTINIQTTEQPIHPNQAIIDEPTSQKKPSFLIPVIFSFIFLLTVGVFGAGSYAVAYEKIKLPDKFQATQVIVSNFVQSLPFTPKTPKFLLEKAVLAQANIKKETYDISVAANSDSFSAVPGLSSIDFLAKGGVDYSDPKDVKFSIDAYLTKDFNFEILRPSKILYFKIKKIPELLLSFAGIKSDVFNPILNKWYSYDPTPLETEARKDLGQPDQEVPSQKYVTDYFDKIVDQKILSEMKVSDSVVDNFAVYKISFTADKEMIDYLGRKIEEADSKTKMPDTNVTDSEKLSDFVKSLSWEINIDKKGYYIRKVSVVTSLEADEISGYDSMLLGMGSSSSGSSKVDIAMAAKFNDFGKDVTIEEPKDSATWKDFTDTISEIFQEEYQKSIGSTYNQSLDAKTKSDLMQIRSALELYKADNLKYPEKLEDLMPTYISVVPTDQNGDSYYFAMSENQATYDICANLNEPTEENNNCPDPTYNYHVSNP